MDVVCYTGINANQSGPSQQIKHNLTVKPELLIIKKRSSVSDWIVYTSIHTYTNCIFLNYNYATTGGYGAYWGNTEPTATNFSVADVWSLSNSTYIAYMFASLAGISKVGSYTGNGGTQTINCGFAAGARFIMIKRTDAAGDWYVWDSARGIAAANDPHLSLNTNAAHVTTDDSIDTANSGFIVNQVAATNINVTSATYIYLAIA
jgi:hypothetical protein